MTILPTKRTTSSGEDNNDNTGQGGNSERTGRRRDEHSSNHIDSNKSSNRRTFRRSATPESNEHSLRKRFKESSKSSGSGSSSAQMGTRRHNRDNQNSGSNNSPRDATNNTSNNKPSPSTKAAKRSVPSQQPQPQPTAIVAQQQQQQDPDTTNVSAVAAHAPDDIQATTDAGGGVGVLGIVPLTVDSVDKPLKPIDQNNAAPSLSQQQEPLEQIEQQSQVQDSLETQQATQQMATDDGACAANQTVSETVDDDATGFNSEDEYSPSAVNAKATTHAIGRTGKSSSTHNPKDSNAVSEEEWNARDATFARCLTNLGYEVKAMHEDGACLFRAIADQVYGDQEMHYVVRSHCMDYIVQNKDFFAPYVTEDFDKYVARKRQWHVHGNHLEIQAMSEMYNRRIEVYCYRIEPINIFSGLTGRGAHGRTYEPIRLSYHRMCHYNSISNPDAPSVGVGLGLPAYHPIDLNRRRLVDAVRASEQLLIEQTMLEDKLQATDWEATSEAIEEAVARESYIQYYRDAERRVRPPAAPTATVTTATTNAASTSTTNTANDQQQNTIPVNDQSELDAVTCGVGTMDTLTAALPNAVEVDGCLIGQQSPQASSSRTNTGGQSPNAGELSEDEWNDGILAQILAESRKTYFDELKRNSKKGGSPGPSTSR